MSIEYIIRMEILNGDKSLKLDHHERELMTKNIVNQLEKLYVLERKR